jgi:predicted O-methyltransferase YrrM
MNPYLAEIYEKGEYVDHKGRTITPFPTSVPIATSENLYRIVSDLGAERTLEVGFAHGVSAMSICQPHLERGRGSHIAIDPLQDSRRFDYRGLLNIKRAGLGDFVRLIEEPSQTALPALAAENTHLDFAFIDGMHTFDHSLIDFFYVDQMLRTGGVVVFDDIWMPSIRQVASFIAANRNYRRMHTPLQWNFVRRLRVSARRMLQTPFAKDFGRLRTEASNVVAFEKLADDTRMWDEHRFFS